MTICGFLRGPQNVNDGNWFVLNYFEHLFVQCQNTTEHDITLMPNFFYLTFFVFDLKSRSMFACRMQQVFKIPWPN